MGILSKFRRAVHDLFLRRTQKASQARKTVNLNTAKHIGILFDAADPSNISTVLGFNDKLIDKKKSTKLLGYLRKTDKKNPEGRFPYFTDKEVNWYLKPGGKLVNEFMDEPFDLVIDATIGECLPLEYISSASRAKFRVGYYKDQKVTPYDFMITLEGEPDMETYMEQVNHYLNMIKTR
jgi:hypothetical protein